VNVVYVLRIPFIVKEYHVLFRSLTYGGKTRSERQASVSIA
jgi:hypothetical protein